MIWSRIGSNMFSRHKVLICDLCACWAYKDSSAWWLRWLWLEPSITKSIVKLVNDYYVKLKSKKSSRIKSSEHQIIKQKRRSCHTHDQNLDSNFWICSFDSLKEVLSPITLSYSALLFDSSLLNSYYLTLLLRDSHYLTLLLLDSSNLTLPLLNSTLLDSSGLTLHLTLLLQLLLLNSDLVRKFLNETSLVITIIHIVEL